jgi:hypothetical protein
VPIYAVNEQSDARGSVRLLADVAKACIADPQKAKRHINTIRNMFDLVEAYRAHGFFGYGYQPHRESSTEMPSLARTGEHGSGDLKSAFDQAFLVYEGRSSEQAIQELEVVLRSMTRGASGVSDDQRSTAVKFLDSFIEKLETA